MLYQLSYASVYGSSRGAPYPQSSPRCKREAEAVAIEKAARREAGFVPQPSAAFSREDEE
jgi:hypothetical protein